MNNELKERLQSVIHEAMQPLQEQLDRIEKRLEDLESGKLNSELNKLELDVKVLKKAITA